MADKWGVPYDVTGCILKENAMEGRSSNEMENLHMGRMWNPFASVR